MDESWRIPIGSVVPRRRSTEQMRRPGGGGLDLDPDDFRDVFGGPPRTVLLRQFSGGDLTTSTSSSSSSSSSTISYFDRLDRYHQLGTSRRRPSFYQEVFGRQLPEATEGKAGRSLPDFTIPSEEPGGGARRAGNDGFYGDIFGWGSERQSRTRSRQSKSNSSSLLSSEDRDGGELVGPHRLWLGDDGVLTSFASKLRPITVPSRRGDARSPASPDEQISSHRTSTVPCPRHSLMDLRFEADGVAGPGAVDPCKLFRPYSPREAFMGVETKMPTVTDDDSGSDSPSSVVSSIYDIPMATIRPARRTHEEEASEKEMVLALEEEEADSSFVIEIVTGRKAAESEGSAALDEAIAWAKEKSRADSSLEGIGGVGEDQRQHTVREPESMHDGRELVKSRGGGDGALLGQTRGRVAGCGVPYGKSGKWDL